MEACSLVGRPSLASSAAYWAARFAGHRFFCACEIRFRAAADILRGLRLAPLAARATLAFGVPFASAVAAAVVAAPARRAAQYFFIRSPTALR